ncbi:MAG: MMPL family transporter [Mycobacteriales bacterium]
MLVRLADWCYRKRRLVVALWIAALVGTFAVANAFGGEFRQNYLQSGSESKEALDILKKKFPQKSGDTIQIVVHSDAGVTSPAAKARAESLFSGVVAAEHVVGVSSPFSEQGARQISRDGKTAYADVDLDKRDNEFTAAEAKRLVRPILNAGDATMRVEVSGAVAKLSQTPEFGSEGIGLIAAVIILLATFGSVVAMGLPLMTALFGLGIAVALGELLNRVVPVPDWAPSIMSMIGIGVGIDYALFIVTRYRSGLAEGQEPRHAVLTSIATAGRAVMFAGSTVVISLLGMLLMNQPFTPGLAFSAVLVVLVVMAASVTLLPATLGFAGRNIERLHVPFVSKKALAYDKSFWYRWSRFIQRRPWPAAVASLGVLLALSAPFLGIRYGFPDAKNDPPQFTTRQAEDLLVTGFGPGFSAPMLLTVQGKTGDALVASADAVGEKLRAVSGVAFVSPAVANAAGDTALLQLVATTSPQDKVTEDLVDSLREETIPAATSGTGLKIAVGGVVPIYLDTTRGVSSRLPMFIGGVVLLSFLLLMMVFRSILVPLKAAVMNLLSITAALGVMALAANGGPVGDLIGIPDALPVPIFMPMIMFAILFGLSMDYEVFLLSRIKEEYDRTGDNGLAVADGLAKTARVITAAAAIMITVFLAFVPSNDILIKLFGIGLASAIFVDATVVRMVLVPATMELLGNRNWWLPGWLDRVLPRIQVEGHEISAEQLDLRDAIVGQRTSSALRTESTAD